MVDKKPALETKVDEPPIEVIANLPSDAWISDQTRAEMELGRKVAQANALHYAAAQARRAEEATKEFDDAEEKERATREARRLGVFPHAANAAIKPS